MASKTSGRGSRRAMFGAYPAVYVGGRKYEYEHRAIAARALGRQLPPKAEVHHVNGDKSSPTPGNLVICEDHAYHMLLHRRTRALRACGNPNWLKCGICRQYDAQQNLHVYHNQRTNRTAGRHRACHAARQRGLYSERAHA